MKVLFIGGTGNISADCAAWAHTHGHEVAVVSRGRSAIPEHYRLIVADRHDPAAMRQALGSFQADVVLNFLGYELSDVQLDFELFTERRRPRWHVSTKTKTPAGAPTLPVGVRQYVFISSASVYAKPPVRLPITEESPLGNRWWEYSQKKLDCERWLLARCTEDGFPLTIVRPSHTYSKRWIPNPLSSSSYTFAARLEQGKPVYVPDDGENPWTLTASSDFAVAVGGLLGRNDTIGEAFHITSDEVLTWNQIIGEIAAALGAPSPQVAKVPTDFICEIAPQMIGTLKGDKAHPGVFDNSKIKRFVPGFRCQKSFGVGVRESVAFLRGHPEHQNLNPKLDQLTDEIIRRWGEFNAKTRMSKGAAL